MNNVFGTVGVPCTVFGGAITELAPEDIPEGGSPFSQDVDFVPGAVFTRGGTQGVYTFGGLFAEDLAGFAVSIPGLHGSNETAWNSPSNVTLNIPGTYASVTLNVAGGSFGAAGTWDYTSYNDGSTGVLQATSSATPTLPNEIAVLLTVGGSNQAMGTLGAPWTSLGSPDGGAATLYSQALSGTPLVTSSQTVGAATNWVTMLMFFGAKVPGVNINFVQNKTISSGGITPGTHSGQFAGNITPGNGILVTLACGITSTHLLSGLTCIDDAGSVYTQVGMTFNVGGVDSGGLNTPTAAVFWCPSPLSANPTVSVTTVMANLSGSIETHEVAGIAA